MDFHFSKGKYSPMMKMMKSIYLYTDNQHIINTWNTAI